MKQRITIEQLKELTELQKSNLRILWLLKYYTDIHTKLVKNNNGFNVEYTTIIIDKEGTFYADLDNITLPLLNIGQMIEILKERTPYSLGHLIGNIIIPDFVVDYHRKELELCDALWEELKLNL